MDGEAEGRSCGGSPARWAIGGQPLEGKIDTQTSRRLGTEGLAAPAGEDVATRTLSPGRTHRDGWQRRPLQGGRPLPGRSQSKGSQSKDKQSKDKIERTAKLLRLSDSTRSDNLWSSTEGLCRWAWVESPPGGRLQEAVSVRRGPENQRRGQPACISRRVILVVVQLDPKARVRRTKGSRALALRYNPTLGIDFHHAGWLGLPS